MRAHPEGASCRNGCEPFDRVAVGERIATEWSGARASGSHGGKRKVSSEYGQGSMTAPHPLDDQDLTPWYEEHEDDLFRRFGCWPFFAALVLSWSAIGFVIWSLW